MIRALPEASTRMFGYRAFMREAIKMFVGAHPLQVSVNHAVGVEVIEALCDVDQLIEVQAKCRGATKNRSRGRPDLCAGSI